MDEGSTMRVELHETEPLNAQGNPLTPIRVELETEEEQPDTAAGLKLVITFTNTGKQTVKIQNPDDSIQLLLQNDKGWPVRVPTPPPRAFINRSEDREGHKNAPQLLSLQPGEQHRATMQIRETEAEDHSEKGPLPPSRYKAQLRVLLIAADSNLERERSYRKLESQQITVDYGSVK